MDAEFYLCPLFPRQPSCLPSPEVSHLIRSAVEATAGAWGETGKAPPPFSSGGTNEPAGLVLPPDVLRLLCRLPHALAHAEPSWEVWGELCEPETLSPSEICACGHRRCLQVLRVLLCRRLREQEGLLLSSAELVGFSQFPFGGTHKLSSAPSFLAEAPTSASLPRGRHMAGICAAASHVLQVGS